MARKRKKAKRIKPSKGMRYRRKVEKKRRQKTAKRLGRAKRKTLPKKRGRRKRKMLMPKKRRAAVKLTAKQKAKHRRDQRIGDRNRAWVERNNIKTRHYKIAKGLDHRVAQRRVARLDGHDYRGFAYNPKTGHASIT